MIFPRSFPYTSANIGTPRSAAPDRDTTRAKIERNAGDLCSALGVLGAGLILASHKRGAVEQVGQYLAVSSMGAAVVDASLQTHNVFANNNDEAKRGNKKSNWRTVAYAATGIIPAASLGMINELNHIPNFRQAAKVGILGLNAVVLGYELIHRTPKIIEGKENLSGYGSLLASVGGFVVARHAMKVPNVALVTKVITQPIGAVIKNHPR